MLEPWQIWAAVAAFLLTQVLQTIQIAIVGRRVSRTLMPPPPPLQAPPPPAAYYVQPFCARCGALTEPRLLARGLCPECVQAETAPTQLPAPVKAPRRPWHKD